MTFEQADCYFTDGVFQALARNATLYEDDNHKINFDSPFFPDIVIAPFDTIEEARAKYLAILRGGKEAHKAKLIKVGVKL
jgi:hypothetical protein